MMRCLFISSVLLQAWLVNAQLLTTTAIGNLYPVVNTKVVSEDDQPIAVAHNAFMFTDLPGYPLSSGLFVCDRIGERLTVSGVSNRSQIGPLTIRRYEGGLGLRFLLSEEVSLGIAAGIGAERVNVDWSTIDRFHHQENMPNSRAVKPQASAGISLRLKNTMAIVTVDHLLQEPFVFNSTSHSTYLLKSVPFFESRVMHQFTASKQVKIQLGAYLSGYKGLPVKPAVIFSCHYKKTMSFILQSDVINYSEIGWRIALKQRVELMYAWQWHYSRWFGSQGHQVGCVFNLHSNHSNPTLPLNTNLPFPSDRSELQLNQLQFLIDSLRTITHHRNIIIDSTIIKRLVVDTLWRSVVKSDSVLNLMPVNPGKSGNGTFIEQANGSAILRKPYVVVMGVYYMPLIAELYRYRLSQQLGEEVDLIQLPRNKLYYVTIYNEKNLDVLIRKYNLLLKRMGNQKLTNGQPWIYQLK